MMIVLIFLISLFPLVGSDIEVIVYGDNSYKPYSYIEGGEFKGIYPKIFRELFDRVDGYRVAIKPIPWKRGLMEVELGSVVAIFPPYNLPEERPYIYPYSDPILEEKVVVVGLKRAIVGRNRWPEDFYGMKVGVNRGFRIGGERFLQSVRDGDIISEEADGNEPNILKLFLGRIDLYLNDLYSIKFTIANLIEKGSLEKGSDLEIGAVVSSEYGHLGYSKSFKAPWKEDFIKKVDKAISELRAEGVIDSILKTYQ